jgi:uncharacterized protein
MAGTPAPRRESSIRRRLAALLCLLLGALPPAAAAQADRHSPAGAADDSAAHPIAPNLDLQEIAPPPDPGAAAGEEVMGPPLPPDGRAQNFLLLGSEVPPATATRLAWTPDGGIGGLAAPTPVLVINGARPGPNLCLTAAVHGDELNGIEIVRRVMYDIQPQRLGGRLIGIPIVNLDGFRRGSRYLSDRRDLNRHFPGHPRGSLASRMAYSLFEEVLDQCDYLVDIHTGSLGRDNLPQVRADMRRDDLAEFTRGFGHIVVLHSPGARGMLRPEALARGILTVTLEVGESQRLQPRPVAAGVRAVNRLLQHLGMYARLFQLGSPEPVYYESLWIRAPTGGILLNEVQLGAQLTQGQQLGTVVDPITNARTPISTDVAGRLIGMAVSQVVMPGFAAYHIGIEAAAEEPIETEDLDPPPEAEVIDDEAAGGEADPEE